MAEYVTREYQRGEEEKIVSLLNLVFKGWPQQDITCEKVDFWKWRYIDNPFGIQIAAVTCLGEDVVGSTQQMTFPLLIGGERVLGALPGNISVHPDHRRRGIAKNLIPFTRDVRERNGVWFMYLATKNPYLVKLHSRVDRVFPHSINNLVKINDLDKHLKAVPVDNELIMRLGYQAVKMSNTLLNMIKRTSVENPEYALVEARSFDERFSRFWDELSPNFDFIVEGILCT